MNSNDQFSRLRFLIQVVEREARHLKTTTQRLFAHPIDLSWVESLEQEIDTAERLDAFVARYGGLQDTIADKLIPELLKRSLETPGTVIDNLIRMEKLGLIDSVDDWIEARNLRNRLVHEYMRDQDEFLQALIRSKELVPTLLNAQDKLSNYSTEKLLAEP